MPSSLSAAAVSALSTELRSDVDKKANNVAKLLPALAPGVVPEAAQREAIRALKLYFLHAFDTHGLSKAASSAKSGEAAAIFQAWLLRQYAACTGRLTTLMQSPKAAAAVQVEALVAVMEFVRGEAVGEFQNSMFTNMLAAMLKSSAFSSVFLGALSNKYLKFADVRFYSLRAVQRVARSLAGAGAGESSSDDEGGREEGEGEERALEEASPSDVARNCFDLLALIPASLGAADNKPLSREQQLMAALKAAAGEQGAPRLLSWCGAAESNLITGSKGRADSGKERRKRKRELVAAGGSQLEARKWANPKLQKQAFSNAWLAFLQMDLPDDIYKKVLEQLHSVVIPHLPNPLLLSDFLSASLDRKEGLTAILALNGIFLLVTKHGLEYPHFYRRLYGLLKPEVFKAKHRAQFFKLVDMFLASSLVPAYTVAAFIKRLARCALVTTPPGAMIAMAYIHNLIRRHPSCFVLLHRPGASSEEEAGVDPYVADCDDPSKSRATESSLWEVAALGRHWSPSVAEMARMLLEKDMTDRRKTGELNIELFSRESYTSMIEVELKKRLKRVPVAFFAKPPDRLFDASDMEGFPGWSLELPC